MFEGQTNWQFVTFGDKQVTIKSQITSFPFNQRTVPRTPWSLEYLPEVVIFMETPALNPKCGWVGVLRALSQTL